MIAAGGCPICGLDNSTWTLLAQVAHVSVDHSMWERLRLRWQSGSPLPTLLARRKYTTPGVAGPQKKGPT